MKIKSSPEIALLKTLTKDHWGPQTDGVMNFLSRDDAAYALLEKIIVDGHWTRPFPFLNQMHAESTAIRQANAAREAIDQMLKREFWNGR